MSCGVGRRHHSDPALLWFWYSPAVTALISPLSWEPPNFAGAALKKKKKKKKRNGRKREGGKKEGKGEEGKKIISLFSNRKLWLVGSPDVLRQRHWLSEKNRV